MIIAELFKPGDHGGTETTNHYGDFNAFKRIGNRDITFSAKKEGRGWEIVFHESDVETGARSFEKTGSGDEVEVFTFVMNSLRAFIRKDRPKRMFFSVDIGDLSRIKLYRRLVERFAKDFYTRELETEELGPAHLPSKKRITFDLIRKDAHEKTSPASPASDGGSR